MVDRRIDQENGDVPEGLSEKILRLSEQLDHEDRKRQADKGRRGKKRKNDFIS